ncbi:MAG: hypothetical protein H6619_02695 [Deltaproteobacteria bacterium]|nr:hypothetical protein [Deltaproteobacteria bacterium]
MPTIHDPVQSINHPDFRAKANSAFQEVTEQELRSVHLYDREGNIIEITFSTSQDDLELSEVSSRDGSPQVEEVARIYYRGVNYFFGTDLNGRVCLEKAEKPAPINYQEEFPVIKPPELLEIDAEVEARATELYSMAVEQISHASENFITPSERLERLSAIVHQSNRFETVGGKSSFLQVACEERPIAGSTETSKIFRVVEPQSFEEVRIPLFGEIPDGIEDATTLKALRDSVDLHSSCIGRIECRMGRHPADLCHTFHSGAKRLSVAVEGNELVVTIPTSFIETRFEAGTGRFDGASQNSGWLMSVDIKPAVTALAALDAKLKAA